MFFYSIWRTFELRKNSTSRPHLGGIVQKDAHIVAKCKGYKFQLFYSVGAICRYFCPRMWPIRHHKELLYDSVVCSCNYHQLQSCTI